MQLSIDAFEATERFQKELQGCAAEHQQQARGALELLLKNPRANSLRCHTLQGYRKPTIYKIDIDANKTRQITFELRGRTARLLRIGTHRELDREPR